MTRTIQQAAELCAREFLGCELRDYGTHKVWVALAECSKPVWDRPGPSWPFFGALWEECKRRGWLWCFKNAPGVVDASDGFTLWTNDVDSEFSDDSGDPREALIRCVEQWLDAAEEE